MKYAIFKLAHGEKKLLNQQMSSAGIGTAVFFCNIYRFFCWIHRLFVNSTDEPVKSTDMSVFGKKIDPDLKRIGWKFHWEKRFDWIKENDLFERLSLV